MRKLIIATLLGIAGALVATAVGCHADENDPAGQAKELSDPVRRENAIANITRLYTNALSKNNGNRAHADVKGIADEVHDELVATYVDHPEDTQSGRKILDLFYEMRDPRTIPALLKALEWRPEVTEEHTISAAKTLGAIEIPEDKKAEVVTKLGESLERITGARPVDNRMRNELIRTLGNIGDRRATPVLTKIATAQVEEQNFLFNRLAAEQIARMGDPEAVPAMVKALFLFAPSRPDVRMNDIATQALVSIGRPSLEPLLAVLRGQDAEANAMAEAYIEAVRAMNPQAASEMSARSITATEATITLGNLGLRDAIEPLVAETQLPVQRASEDGPDVNETRRIAASIALASINRTDADAARIREALVRVYNNAEKVKRMQLLVIMQHAIDPGLLPFLLEQARRPEEELPDIRVIALRAYSFLANAQEAAAATAVINAEDPEGYRRAFEENNPALAAATECNEDVACWTRKLNDGNERVVRKAAYMLARYGRGNAQVIDALLGKINHREVEVRSDVFYAIDYVANAGSSTAVERIEALRREEEGRAIWNQIKEIALMRQARLRARAPQQG